MLKNITLRIWQKNRTLHKKFRAWLARWTATNAGAARNRKLTLELQHVVSGRGFSHDDFNAR